MSEREDVEVPRVEAIPVIFRNPDVHAPSVTLSNHTNPGNQPYNDPCSDESGVADRRNV